MWTESDLGHVAQQIGLGRRLAQDADEQGRPQHHGRQDDGAAAARLSGPWVGPPAFEQVAHGRFEPVDGRQGEVGAAGHDPEREHGGC